MDQVQLQVVIGVVMSYVIQFLKKTPWCPIITERTDKIVQVAFSALVAAGSALAVSFSYDSTLGQLTVTGLTWANMGHGLLNFLVSLISQQGAYRLFFKPKQVEG